MISRGKPYLMSTSGRPVPEGGSYRDVVGGIESAIRERWREEGLYAADMDAAAGGHRYVLGMFPYPSGKAHLGHVLVYTVADALARMGRFKGENVLNPLGWDGFGLPAENAAIAGGVHPADWTDRNIALMREEIGRGGFSFDLSRELNTSRPEFYRWTQWLFLKLYEHGQAYRAESWVNWDPVDRTVLANEQVIDGHGWRSGALVERRKMEQWCLRITDYAQALHDGLAELNGWSRRAVNAQRYWIGRSEGVEIDFTVPGSGIRLVVFTTRPDTVYGVTAVTVAPEHPDIDRLTAPRQAGEVSDYVAAAMRRTELERQSDDGKSGVFLGTHAINPMTGDKVPIWVSDYVIGSYGTGAIMNVPAHDQRDFDFARAHSLPVRQVIVPTGAHPAGELTAAYTEAGIMYDSAPFTGLPSEQARDAITAALEERNAGRRSVRFRLRDWSIGRQRYWGCPIPMVRLADGTWKPVPYDELPVVLPREVNFGQRGARAPLETSPSFTRYGTDAVREVDTMDTFVDSSWYAWRFLAADGSEAWPPGRARYWMPVDYYVGGLEHATQHMIYFRYISHFLHSIGLTPSREPVVNFLDNGMVRLGGSKMSKSKGNTVSPDEVISQYGADPLRLYLLSDAPFENDRDWDDAGLSAKQRFLGHIWSMGQELTGLVPRAAFAHPPADGGEWGRDAAAALATVAARFSEDVDEKRSFHTAIARLHSFASALSTYREQAGSSPQRLAVLGYLFQQYLKMVGVFAPHLADTLWRQVTGAQTSIFGERWVPQTELGPAADTTIPVQLNGKLVGTVSVPATLLASDQAIVDMVLAAPPAQLADRMDGMILHRTLLVRGKRGEPRLLSLVAHG
jgi:leucyl-tRNA synthetase